MTEEAALHSLLESEIAAVQEAFGDNAIECRYIMMIASEIAAVQEALKIMLLNAGI